jgi:glutamyl-tRNA synthetase
MHKYVGRVAPSPTGLLHLGHARTFLAAFDRARDAGGTLLLRNEDLDTARVRAAFVTAMVEDLAWLGIAWRPPMVTQSARLPLYRAALDQLIVGGVAYPCVCSRRELQRAISAPHEGDDEPVYDGRCRPRPGGQRAFVAGVNYRFRVPDGEVICFSDGNVGEQRSTAGCDAATADFGDFLLWRKDGLPSYQLACVVDDAAMRITEIVRGADLLKSTARQRLVAQALGYRSPATFHTQLVRDANGVRLAKRHDALAIRTLRERGLRPEELRTLALEENRR